MRRAILLLVLLAAVAGVVFTAVRDRNAPLVLTGIVTTNDVIVAPQVAGQVSRLLVHEGDTVVRDQLVAVIAPDELKADEAYYTHSAEGLAVQVQEGEAALRYQQQQTEQQIRQATATLAAATADRASAQADFDNAKLEYDRVQALVQTGAITKQELDKQRAQYEMSKAKLDAAQKQLEAQQAALALARAAQDQVAMKRSALGATEAERAAAAAQTQKATVRLAYSELHAPIAGVVDVCAAREGEVVSTGQPVLTLVNPDDLWVRADIEESYIDRVRIGDKLTVRTPSGETREGTVFYRGVDAGFATQRDVSRTKRDIKTFEVRLRVDNTDRRLAVGMTMYVLFPRS